MNYESDIQDAISEMHPELIVENIKVQIDAGFINPYKINYLKNYIYQYKYLMKEYEDDINVKSKLKDSLDQTLTLIIQSISEKFGFTVDIENIGNKRNIAKALYKFFVLKYEDNLIEFITNYIILYKKQIINIIKNERGNIKKSKNVTTIANKLIYSPNEAIILSNINYIITEIIPSVSFDENYLELLDSNSASYNLIKELFNENMYVSLDENPFEMFIAPIAEKESGYGTIISEVTVKLAKLYNKKEDINIIDNEENNKFEDDESEEE